MRCIALRCVVCAQVSFTYTVDVTIRRETIANHGIVLETNGILLSALHIVISYYSLCLKRNSFLRLFLKKNIIKKE